MKTSAYLWLFSIALAPVLTPSIGEAAGKDGEVVPPPSLPLSDRDMLRVCYRSNTSWTAGCPTGFYCHFNTTEDSEGHCRCYTPPNGISKCDDRDMRFYVLDCVCATFDEEESELLIGPCVVNCGNGDVVDGGLHDAVYHPLPKDRGRVNTKMCHSMNRNGSLCGKCMDDHYPLAYSFSLKCVLCPNWRMNILWYIMAAYLPLTFFYFLVIFFRWNAVSTHLHPIVFFSQSFSLPALVRAMLLNLRYQYEVTDAFKVILSFHGIWNLDFFRPFSPHPGS